MEMEGILNIELKDDEEKKNNIRNEFNVDPLVSVSDDYICVVSG